MRISESTKAVWWKLVNGSGCIRKRLIAREAPCFDAKRANYPSQLHNKNDSEGAHSLFPPSREKRQLSSLVLLNEAGGEGFPSTNWYPLSLSIQQSSSLKAENLRRINLFW
uniref:Uncharacterized protein n=1 Tax=Romanomermis culicivorax TaxID=13658 RepID=A0A915J123_ROMCU